MARGISQSCLEDRVKRYFYDLLVFSQLPLEAIINGYGLHEGRNDLANCTGYIRPECFGFYVVF